jgi:predicted site-specific integrase-resolvase
MKLKCFLFLILSVALFTGCRTIGPQAAGQATGRAVYLGYSKVAEKKPEAFTNQVNALWAKVNQLETLDDLVNQVDYLTASFDAIINDSCLSEEERVVLISLKNMVVSKVKLVMKSKLQTNMEAVEFLASFRDGVNDAITMMNLIKSGM